MSDDFGVLHTFRFDVKVESRQLKGPQKPPEPVTGSFSECTGLEGTMEQKVIKVGGRNVGAIQRAGQVTFATVILKRGITKDAQLVKWFSRVAKGQYHERANVLITLLGPPAQAAAAGAAQAAATPSGAKPSDLRPVVTYKLENALPVKFKAADFNARATDVGIEELHLVHEGLSLDFPKT